MFFVKYHNNIKVSFFLLKIIYNKNSINLLLILQLRYHFLFDLVQKSFQISNETFYFLTSLKLLQRILMLNLIKKLFKHFSCLFLHFS